jgi:hypothetical protein
VPLTPPAAVAAATITRLIVRFPWVSRPVRIDLIEAHVGLHGSVGSAVRQKPSAGPAEVLRGKVAEIGNARTVALVEVPTDRLSIFSLDVDPPYIDVLIGAPL